MFILKLGLLDKEMNISSLYTPIALPKVPNCLNHEKLYPEYLGLTRCQSTINIELTDTLDKELCGPKERQLELSERRLQSLGGGLGRVGIRDVCL